jgi:MFS family permease
MPSLSPAQIETSTAIERSRRLPEPLMSRARLIFWVLLPFAAGYYLSYLFRTINALIANDLTAELNLSAGDLGFLTSVYFLALAASQLPLGAMLDRYGPGTIQSALLLFASAGALVFAMSTDLFGLVIGRGLVGLGVALALMAGFKAIVLWAPPERVTLANGWLVMLGALGSVTATGPAELVVHAIGWRGLFAALAALCAIAALLIAFAVPEPMVGGQGKSDQKDASVWAIYRDSRFWRVAPLSATGIGTSWSLQGLWAAPWLRDVDRLGRSDVVQHLTVMALAVCVSALLLGTVAGRLRRMGVKTEWVLASALMSSMAAQALLLLRFPVPSLLLWPVIAAAGGATVLSFAILAEYFPKEISGRANAALNLLHLGCAFVLQSATGFVIQQWPESYGMHPPEAHELAMIATLTLQLAALAWFVAPPLRWSLPEFVGALRQYPTLTPLRPALRRLPYTGRVTRAQDRHRARGQLVHWRLAAAASSGLCAGLAAAIPVTASRPALAIHIVEADRTDASLPDGHRAAIRAIGDLSINQAARFAASWPRPPSDTMLSAVSGAGPIFGNAPHPR